MRRASRHPLSGGRAPAWANAWGEDEYGPWVELHLGARARGGAQASAARAAQGGAAQRFRWIPPGVARLGAPETEWGRRSWDWQPTTWRLRDGFWLADTPCTCALWAEVIGGDAGPEPSTPKVEVSWEDTRGFFDALRARDPAFSFELPTEARWEYACRAGTETSTYAGELTDEPKAKAILDRIAWFDGNARRSMPVAAKVPNGWGLFDTLGNVWEWCADAWEWGGAPLVDAAGPRAGELGSNRVLRGGSWYDVERYVRAAYRSAREPGDRHSNVGFRLSRGP